jgi:multidrug resistance protein, MATE family
MSAGLIRFVPGRVELRALYALAIPIVVVQVGIMFMGVVDTIMVGHLSPDALAAVAAGNMYFYAVAIFGMGTLMALDPIISQAVGAHDHPAIARAIQRGLIIAALLTVWVGFALLFAGPVLRSLKQPAEVVPMAAVFSRALIPGIFPLLAFVVFRQSLQAMAIMRPIVIAMIVSNLVNAGLNWVLIFGHLGAPAMGVAGSAWATTISRWMLLGFVLAFSRRTIWPYVRHWQTDSFSRAPLARVLHIGAPIGLHQILEYGAFGAVMMVMGTLGTTQIASHQVAINLASLTFMVPLGVAQAGGVLVGTAIGRGDNAAARHAAGAAMLLGVGFMFVTAIVFLAAPHVLAAIYTTDAGVLALSAALIQVAGVFQVFDGLQVVGSGVLRGVGDTRVPMIAGLLGFWVFGMPVSVYLGTRTSLGAVGLWWGLVLGLAIVGVFLLYRAYHHLGRDHSRIAVDQVAVAT